VVSLVAIALVGQPVFWGPDVTRVILPSVLLNLLLIPAMYGLLSMVSRQTSRERLQW